MAKFKVGDKVRVREDLAIDRDYDGVDFVDGMEAFKGKILKITSIEDYAYNVEENGWYWTDKMLEEVKEDKMEKTFREVIADIKEGEVWESHCKRIIGLSCGDIKICDKHNDNFGASVIISSTNIYKLQRKEYTFEEAFKAYEEGKEIESCSFQYKKVNNYDCFRPKGSVEWVNSNRYFNLEEIRNKWYIND